MRLVFVHGMRQEKQEANALRKAWEEALCAAWQKLGLAIPAYDLEMPFYGKVLGDLVDAVHQKGNIVARGGDASKMSPVEDALIKDYATKLGISDDEVQLEMGQEILARGAANWEWVQGIARVLVQKFPIAGELALDFVVQVDAYLTRPHITKAVNDIVRPAIEKEPAVIVSHSLGTIVSYAVLKNPQSSANAPLFMTLGSPLGIPTVRSRLGSKNLSVPKDVGRWVNGTDQRDYVALYAELSTLPSPPTIENIIGIHNRLSDAHQILDYLAQEPVAKAIHAGLTATSPK